MAKLGYLEMVIKATDAEGNAHTLTTTPSQWMLADEWADKLRASGAHTEAWVLNKLEQGIWLLALIENGLMPDTLLSLPAIGEMWNRYEVERVETFEVDDDAEDPTQAAKA